MQYAQHLDKVRGLVVREEGGEHGFNVEFIDPVLPSANISAREWL